MKKILETQEETCGNIPGEMVGNSQEAGKHNIEGTTMIITGIKVPETNRQNVSHQNGSMISIDRVFHTSDKLRWLFIVTIFMNNSQNRKAGKAISQTAYAVDNTPHATGDCVKKLYRK